VLWKFEVLPSPKFQNQEEGDPVLVSVNVTVNGTVPEVGEGENDATGDVTLLLTLM
jgi:hypothetical protein